MSKSKGGGTGRGTDSKGWTRWKGKSKGKPAVKDNSKILGAKGAGASNGGKGVSSGGLKWTESGTGTKNKNGIENRAKTRIENGKNENETRTESRIAISKSESDPENSKNEYSDTKTEKD